MFQLYINFLSAYASFICLYCGVIFTALGPPPPPLWQSYFFAFFTFFLYLIEIGGVFCLYFLSIPNWDMHCYLQFLLSLNSPIFGWPPHKISSGYIDKWTNYNDFLKTLRPANYINGSYMKKWRKSFFAFFTFFHT